VRSGAERRCVLANEFGDRSWRPAGEIGDGVLVIVTVLPPIPPLAKTLVGLGLVTGLRRGELFALRWKDLGEGDATLQRSVSYRNSAGRDFRNTVEEIVTHVTMHGSYHRGQIARIIRASGGDPPYTDYIQFMRRDQLA